MSEFVEVITSYPTVVFTVLVGVVLGYWLLVILGAIDIEALDPSGLLDGLDGAADGAAEGIDGVAEGVGGGAEGLDVPEAEGLRAGSGGGAGLLTALGLKGVPLSITMSLLFVFSWGLTGFAMQAFGMAVPAGLPRIAVGTAIAASAVVVAFLATAVLLRPLRTVFVSGVARSRASFVGKTCRITTGRVDEKFGQAELDDEGTSLLVDVRCAESNELRKGSRALIYDYDRARETYLVVPHEEA